MRPLTTPKWPRVIEGLVVCWLCLLVMVLVPSLRIGGGVAVLVFGASVALLCGAVATAAIADALWIHRALADPPPVLVGLLLYAALPATAVALVAYRAGASAGRWAVLYLALMALGGVAWVVYWIASCGQNCM